MKKVLVTGANGYLGARISKHLAENGFEITALCHSAPVQNFGWNNLIGEIIIGDINNKDVFNEIISQDFYAVIHLISLDHNKSESDPVFVSSVNVVPTWMLLNNLILTNVKKFIYFSTFQVYGKIDKGLVSETNDVYPANSYGLTHLLSENICNYYSRKRNISCINIRLTNSYGSPVFLNNNCWWLVVNDLCKTAFEEAQIKLLSDGSPQRDFVHVSDVSRVTQFLLELNDLGSTTLNFSSGQTITILELAHLVKVVFGKRYGQDIPIYLVDHSISEKNNNTISNRYIVNNEKILKMGFQFKMNLETGINELFDYLEKLNG